MCLKKLWLIILIKRVKYIFMTVTRVDKKDTLFGIVDQLQLLAQKYLVHRFMVSNDTYWKNFIQNSPFDVVWLDYSQNINLTEKFQVQSADYSEKQQTLHNTVLYSPNNKTTKYIYHRWYEPWLCFYFLCSWRYNFESHGSYRTRYISLAIR